LNVLGASRSAGRPVITSGETATEQLTLDFDQLVTGSATVRLNVK
jgi:hypothetical protein